MVSGLPGPTPVVAPATVPGVVAPQSDFEDVVSPVALALSPVEALAYSVKKYHVFQSGSMSWVSGPMARA